MNVAPQFTLRDHLLRMYESQLDDVVCTVLNTGLDFGLNLSKRAILELLLVHGIASNALGLSCADLSVRRLVGFRMHTESLQTAYTLRTTNENRRNEK